MRYPKLILGAAAATGLALAFAVKTSAPGASSWASAPGPGRVADTGTLRARRETTWMPRPVRMSSNVATTGSRSSIIARAVDLMGSMSRPQTATERDLEDAMKKEIAVLTDPTDAPVSDWVPGRPIPGSLRVLATGLGHADETLYAFRTERGRVCGGLQGKGGGCIEGFTDDHGVSDATLFESDGTLIVFGFAPDRVESIRATVDGYTVSAPVRNNSYFIELASTAPTEIVLEVLPPANGTSETIAFSFAYANEPGTTP
jgi:hypothetical protein